MMLMSVICTCSLIGMVGSLLAKKIESLEKRVERLENKNEVGVN